MSQSSNKAPSPPGSALLDSHISESFAFRQRLDTDCFQQMGDGGDTTEAASNDDRRHGTQAAHGANDRTATLRPEHKRTVSNESAGTEDGTTEEKDKNNKAEGGSAHPQRSRPVSPGVGALGRGFRSGSSLPTSNEASMPYGRYLCNVSHFFALPLPHLQYVSHHMLRREYNPGDIILERGDIAQHVYFVIQGGVEVFSMQSRPVGTEANSSWFNAPSQMASQVACGGGSAVPPVGMTVLAREGSIAAGGQFGFDHIILGEKSAFRFVATRKQQPQRHLGGSNRPSRPTSANGMHRQDSSPGSRLDMYKHAASEVCLDDGICFSVRPEADQPKDGEETDTSDAVADLCPGDVQDYDTNRRTVIGMLPAKAFLTVLARSKPFAQSIGRKMSEHMDVFRAMKDFVRSIFSLEASTSEYLDLPLILEKYAKIENCIHSKCNSPEIDTSAWLYAVRRLPDNITSTFCFDLGRALPPFIADRMRKALELVERKQQQQATNQLLLAASASTARSASANWLPPSRGSSFSAAATADSQAAAASGTGDIVFIPTKERRRCCWELGVKGKTLVLLRDGFTDMLDFITCLCVHIFEAKTLRARLQGMVHPPAVDILDNVLSAAARVNAASTAVVAAASHGLGSPPDEDPDVQRAVLAKFPLTDFERAGMHAIWPKNVMRRIYEVLMHREEFMLRVDSSLSRRFQVDPFHEWVLGIRKTILAKLNLPAYAPLPDDLIVDVISSNTHSTKNCLSRFARVFRDEILQYGQQHQPGTVALKWDCEEDLVYVLMAGYLALNPHRQDDHIEALRACGIEIMDDTALTGLKVEIIPVNRIDLSLVDRAIKIAPAALDNASFVRQHTGVGDESPGASPLAAPSKPPPSALTAALNSPEAIQRSEASTDSPVTSPVKFNTTLRGASFSASQQKEDSSGGSRAATPGTNLAPPASSSSTRPVPLHFIINTDFAFGAQAEGITRALVTIFGKRIRSFNVMGKAGGLIGKRGDVQLATNVLFSKSSLLTEDPLDELRACGNHDVSLERLKQLAGPSRSVHCGNVLTIPGTMLQNAKLLRFYRTIWQCVGVEMEGSYFARQIREAQRAHLLSPDVITRFAYYSSDLPLEVSASTNLSASMKPNEGTPPLYAIMRLFLEQILN